MKGSTARYLWISALVALVVAAAAMAMAAREDKPREIRLVVRDMTFFLDGGDDTPNPPLKFRAGERVRVVLRNDDPGMNHDFAIRAWNVGTELLEGKGKEAAIEFRVPEARAPQEYTCTPHSAMMRGAIEIE